MILYLQHQSFQALGDGIVDQMFQITLLRDHLHIGEKNAIVDRSHVLHHDFPTFLQSFVYKTENRHNSAMGLLKSMQRKRWSNTHEEDSRHCNRDNRRWRTLRSLQWTLSFCAHQVFRMAAASSSWTNQNRLPRTSIISLLLSIDQQNFSIEYHRFTPRKCLENVFAQLFDFVFHHWF